MCELYLKRVWHEETQRSEFDRVIVLCEQKVLLLDMGCEVTMEDIDKCMPGQFRKTKEQN